MKRNLESMIPNYSNQIVVNAENFGLEVDRDTIIEDLKRTSQFGWEGFNTRLNDWINNPEQVVAQISCKPLKDEIRKLKTSLVFGELVEEIFEEKD